jgi:hypothetical protein
METPKQGAIAQPKVNIVGASRDLADCSIINVHGTGVTGVNVDVDLTRLGQGSPEQQKSVPCINNQWSCQFTGTSELSFYLVEAKQGGDEDTTQVSPCSISDGGLSITKDKVEVQAGRDKTTLCCEGTGPEEDRTVIVELVELDDPEKEKGLKRVRGRQQVPRACTEGCDHRGWSHTFTLQYPDTKLFLIKVSFGKYMKWRFHPEPTRP